MHKTRQALWLQLHNPIRWRTVFCVGFCSHKGGVLLLLLVGMLSLYSLTAAAAIYKWVGEDGRTHFTDKPPRDVKSDTVKLQINTITTPKLQSTDLDLASPNTVIMYSAVWCGVCKKAKNYFKTKRIAFKEYDIEKSVKGKRDFKHLGGRGVPVILVGKKRLNGFSIKSFEAIYRG